MSLFFCAEKFFSDSANMIFWLFKLASKLPILALWDFILCSLLAFICDSFRFSLFGEGQDYEWSLTADHAVSKTDALVSEAVVCTRGTTECTSAQITNVKKNYHKCA